MMRVLRRLARMPPGEFRFRTVELVRTGAEAAAYFSSAGRQQWHRETLVAGLDPTAEGLSEVVAVLRARDWLAAERSLRAHFCGRPGRFTIDPAAWQAVAGQVREEFPDSPAQAAARGERLLEGKFDLLGYTGLTFGESGAIDWHLDPVHGRRAPSGFWKRVPYLDPRSGDHKLIWELNRHQHWLALGRAAWLTGDRRYTDACVRQLESWMAANPPLTGVNWASMLELAFRVLSWVWALHFLVAVDRDEPQTPWLLDLLLGIDRQLNHVAAHLSTYFSPNTHLLGEAVALYVAGRALPELSRAPVWSDLGRRVLVQESTAQVHADGGHAELSSHYHRYALDFYLLALIVARRTGDDGAASTFEDVVSRMADFCRALADDRGRLPLLGDDDGGMQFPICGREPADARDSLWLAASLLQRPELAIGGPAEEALWMLGGDRSALARPGATFATTSRAFPDTGYVVLRSAGEHLVFDAGHHGFANGGHAHADALSIVLTVADQPLLIDPGTATYTMDPALRDRFRSSAMHNTLVLDGRMQSEPSGPFHWRTRANGRCEVWRPGSAFDYVEGSHDGYAPVIHRRAVLTTREGLWIVVDHVLADATDSHAAEAYWHLDPAWRTHWIDDASAQFVDRAGRWAAMASTAPYREHFRGDSRGLGWCAPEYGRLVPATTLRYSGAVSGATSLVTIVAAANAPRELAVQLAPTSADSGDEWHRVGATITFGDSRYVALFSTPLGGSAPPARMPQRVSVDDVSLATDARVALLKLSQAGEPLTLSLVDGRAAIWSGDPPMTLALPGSAADLHLDIAAQRRLSRASDSRRLR